MLAFKSGTSTWQGGQLYRIAIMCLLVNRTLQQFYVRHSEIIMLYIIVFCFFLWYYWWSLRIVSKKLTQDLQLSLLLGCMSSCKPTCGDTFWRMQCGARCQMTTKTTTNTSSTAAKWWTGMSRHLQMVVWLCQQSLRRLKSHVNDNASEHSALHQHRRECSKQIMWYCDISR